MERRGRAPAPCFNTEARERASRETSLSQASQVAGRTVKCPNCAATFEITPDALAYVCRYCGWVGTTEDIAAKGWLMADPVPHEAAQQGLTEFLKKHLKHAYRQIGLQDFRMQAIPFWIAKVHARTRYNGYRQETRTESYPATVPFGRGGRRTEMRTRSYPVYIPVQGEFDEVLTYPILGRRNAIFFGLDELKKRTLLPSLKPLDVKALLTRKVDCLDIEMEEAEATAAAESLGEDEHRARAKAMTTKLFDCYTEDEVQSTRLVFYPVGTAKYTYQGKSFRVALDGVSGDVVKAELPMTLGLRLGYAFLGYLGVGLTLAVSYGLGTAEDPSPFLFVIIAAGAALAVWSMLKATSEQRIKRR